MMSLRKYIFLPLFHLTLFVVSFLATAPVWAGLQEDMLHLEQRYIPVVLYAAQRNAQALDATVHLLEQWYGFKQAHAYRHQDDPLWDFDMVALEQDLLDTQRLLQSGQYDRAVAVIQRVGQRIRQIRTRHKLRFYIDDVAGFDVAMQALLSRLASDQADASYTEIAEALAVWRKMMKVEVNLYDYGLNRQQIEYLRRCQLEGERLLASMEENFLAARYAQLPEQGVQMQHLYTETYAIFGRH